MKTMITMALGFSLIASQAVLAANVVSPTSVKVKVYKMWAFTNEDCQTGSVEVMENSSPSYIDVSAGETFGQGSLTNGTYKCVALRMSDLIKFTPAESTDNGNCVASQETSIDVFGETSTCPDGSTTSGTRGVEDQMCIYIGTGGSNSDETNPFGPSTPFLMSSDWSVSGDVDAHFGTDFRNKVEDNGGQCDLQPPLWIFR